MGEIRRVREEELKRALELLEPLFDSVRLTVCPGGEPPAGEESEGLRSRRFLLDGPGGEHWAELEIADRSLPAALLRQQLYRDDLTGVYNRRYLNELRAFPDRAVQRLGIVMLDLRGFKQVNDTWGHLAGDGVLQQVAAALERCRAQRETVVRFGGDEFVVLLPDCREEDLPAKLRAMAAAVEPVTPADLGWAWTACFHPSEESLADLLEAADRRMYLEKRRRNG